MNTLQSNYSTSINGSGSTALMDASDSVLNTLKLLANGSNFRTIINQAFGDQFNNNALNSLSQQWLTGNFSSLPQVEIRAAADLGGALAGYAQSTNKIYLSQEFLTQHLNNSSAIQSVLLEEIGHFIDAQINATDTPGDEGAIFRELLSGLGLTPQQLQALRAENDQRTVTIDGVTTSIETATPPVNNLGVLSSSIGSLLSTIRTELASQVLSNLPLLDNLNLQTYVNQFIGSTLENALVSELNKITTQSTANVQQALFNALNGLGILQDLGTDGVKPDDIQATETATKIGFQFKIGQVFKSNLNLSENLGLPNLGLDLDGGISSDLNLGLTLGFGVDDSDTPAEAFFVNTGITNEFQVGLQSQFKDINNQPLNLDGTLGFLRLNATDNGSNLTANFTGDLTGLGTGGLVKTPNFSSLDIVSPALNANADLKLKLSTGLDNGALPSIGADLSLTGLQYNSTNPATPAPNVAFDNVYLDAGSFFGNDGFIKDVLDSIKQVLEPFRPIIDVLGTKLPLLNRSLVELAEFLSNAGVDLGTGSIGDEALAFVELLKDIQDVVDAIPTNAAGLKLNLGNFNLGGTDIRNTTVTGVNPNVTNTSDPLGQLNSSGNTSISNFLNALNDLVDDGDTNNQKVTDILPILSDPNAVFRALLGQQVDLFKFNTPKLSASLNIESPPIPIVGPISIKFGGGADIGAQASVGYDTQGLIDFRENNFQEPDLLLNGFFIDKPSSPKIEDSNLSLTGEINASAGVSFSFLSLFVGGGVGLTVGWNLVDKVRGSTIATTSNPLCLFNAKGELAVIIFGQFELDFGFFSISERLDIADIKLADFSQDCDSGAPNYNVFAEPDPNSPLAAQLAGQGVVNRKSTDNGDNIIVLHLSGSTGSTSTEVVEVQGLDTPAKQYNKVKVIVINGKAGNDLIEFRGGVESPGQLDGGEGNDTIKGGKGDDFITGGVGFDSIDGGAAGKNGNTAIYSGGQTGIIVDLRQGQAISDGYGAKDILVNIQNVEGTNLSDRIIGTNEKNILTGGIGDDTLLGFGGDDVLQSGAGADVVNGGSGTDTVTYLASRAPVYVNLSDVAFSATLPTSSALLSLAANRGVGGDADGDRISNVENVQGSVFDDILVARDQAGNVDGFFGNDILIAGSGADTLNGGEGNDWISYRRSNAPVAVNLKTGLGFFGFAEGDILVRLKDDNGNITEKNTFENLEGSFSLDALVGDIQNNIIRGLAGTDFIQGDDGDDTLIGGADADTLDGGTGIDWADYSESPGAVQVNLATGIGTGADAQGDRLSNIENLRGSDHSDDLIGNDNNNEIAPGLSNEPGDAFVDDFVDGGGGTDRLIIDYSRRDIGTGVTGGYALGSTNSGDFNRNTSNNANVLDAVQFTNIERLEVNGTFKNDVIYGGAGSDLIFTGVGDDTIYGGFGGNTIRADDGNDVVIDQSNANRELFQTTPLSSFSSVDGGGGIDTLSIDLSTKFSDIKLISLNPLVENLNQTPIVVDGTTITGFEIFKAIRTGRGNDTLSQLGRVNNLFSTDYGNDTVNAGLGIDEVGGGYDDDLLIVDYSAGDVGTGMFSSFDSSSYYRFDNNGALLDQTRFNDFERFNVTGTSKDDLILGFGKDTLIGLDGNDSLEGNRQSDSLSGGAGNDTLRGADSLYTSGTIDTLSGGTGADLFVLGDATYPYYAVDGNQDYALITDFNAAEGDILGLTLLPSISFNGQYQATVNGNNTELYTVRSSTQDLIAILQGVTNFDLNASYVKYISSTNPLPPFVASSPTLAAPSPSQTLALAAAETPDGVPAAALAAAAPAATAFKVDQNNDTAALLTKLLGNTTGLTPSRMELIGDIRAFGIFENDPFGLGSGVVLSTGKVVDLPGVNTGDGTTGNPDLRTDFGFTGAENDNISMNIEFEADANAKYFYFQFVFGSEEFIEFSGSKFNDAFSLKLNGLNLAQLNDGSAVTINNVTPSVLTWNSDFIHNPVGTGPAANDTKLDGYTKVLTFAGPIIPNQKNLLEINVQDVSDGIYDSAVFLKAGTFGVTPPPGAGGGGAGGGGGAVIPGTPGVTVDQGDDGLNVTEGGATDSFMVSLNSAPTSTVTITITPDAQLNLGSGGGTPITLTFTPGNALTPQKVTLSAVDDSVIEDFHAGAISFTTSSSDPAYNGLPLETLAVLIEDNDTVISPNIINGTPGRDTLVGTSGADIITGLAGADTITGGDGADIFRYVSDRDAGDILKDFTVGVDKIRVTELLAGLGYKGTNPIADGYLLFVSQGSNTIIQLDTDGLAGTKVPRNFITVENVSLNALNNPNNFVF